jgi:hypothetical protein
MKIRMLTLFAGPSGVMENGREYDVNPALAKQLIDGHYAVSVEKKPASVVIENAAAPVEPVEKAVIDSSSPRKKSHK